MPPMIIYVDDVAIICECFGKSLIARSCFRHTMSYLNNTLNLNSVVRRPGITHYFCSLFRSCLLYTSDAADEEDSVDLGGRRIIKKKKYKKRHKSITH